MEITTKETSALLIAAGMPVPDVKVGQIYYDNDGGIYAIGRIFTELVIRPLFKSDWENISEIKNFTPAFTATDILRELPGYYVIMYTGNDFRVRDFIKDDIYHANPAEAAALAFIAQKNA